MPLPYTRRMVNWILSGEHEGASFHNDPIFGIAVPDHIDEIPENLLFPEQTWEDKKAFTEIANRLKEDFEENFKKFEPFLN